MKLHGYTLLGAVLCVSGALAAPKCKHASASASSISSASNSTTSSSAISTSTISVSKASVGTTSASIVLTSKASASTTSASTVAASKASTSKASSSSTASSKTSISTTSASTYLDHAESALDRLEQWYVKDTGLWTSYDPSWWQSANALTTVIDMAIAGSSKAKTVANSVIPNTFTAAAAWDVKNNHNLRRRDENGYINGYYDDEAWWALAWLEAYDLTKNNDYLDTAEILFQDMTTGWGTNCSTGGLWWDKDDREIASISNTLFIETAAWLANRVGDDKKSTYVNWAVKAWDWFRASIMYEPDKHFIVGDINPKTCALPANPNAFTYAHGALVSGLLALSRATGNSSYLDEAHGVAARVIADMTTKAGVLEEPRIDQAHPGQAAPQFKGVFMRALARLYEASPRDAYVDLARASADSIWANDRNGTALGPDWSGPFYGDANASPHSSAMDALVAAWRVTK